MAGMFPLSRMQQFDENGELLVGARLFLFDGGTTTPRVGYRDSSLTTAHPNPIIADAQGRLPLIFIQDGFYRQRLTTASGVVVFDDDGIPVLSTTVAGTGTSVNPDATLKTRDIKVRFAPKDEKIDGYVRLNGQTIGSVASGASERANADTQSLYEELWVLDNIVVSGGKGSSGPADFLANKPLVLPDCAGRGIFGMDNMGAGARGVLTTAVVGTDPTLVGSYGGSQQVTIAQAHLPVYTLTGGTSSGFTVSGTSSPVSNDHTHTQQGTFTSGTESALHSHNVGNTVTGASANNNSGGGGGALGAFVGPTTTTSSTESVAHTHNTTISGQTGGISANHTHTFSWTGTAPNITIGSGGSGTAVNKLPPIMTFMIYVRL
jgi:hypothetical protein